jgi:hypothetical protein
MNRLTYSLAALLLGVAASTTAFASPQDVHASALSAGQAFGRDSFESPISSLATTGSSPRTVKVGYASLQTESSANLLGSTSYAVNSTSNKRDSAASEELPQNKTLTFLVGAAVIFVIAKRRLASRKS